VAGKMILPGCFGGIFAAKQGKHSDKTKVKIKKILHEIKKLIKNLSQKSFFFILYVKEGEN